MRPQAPLARPGLHLPAGLGPRQAAGKNSGRGSADALGQRAAAAQSPLSLASSAGKLCQSGHASAASCNELAGAGTADQRPGHASTRPADRSFASGQRGRGRMGLWSLVLAVAAATACLPRADSDLSGRPNDGGRPDVYGPDGSLAPIMGGNGAPGDANTPLDPTMAPSLGDNPNAIAFTSAAALFVPADNGNETGPTVTLFAQPASCADLRVAAPARQGLALQVQFADKVTPGTYQVVAGAGDTLAGMAVGQASAALLNNGMALLGGGVGEVVVSTSNGSVLELAKVQLTFANGQSLQLGQIEAQVCPAPSPVAPEKFVAAAAYFTQATSGVGPILTLVDLPITCSNLRSPSSDLPDGASLLRIYFGDAALQGSYALFDTNAINLGSLSPGKASARLSKPMLTTTATAGALVVQRYSKDRDLAGSVTATFSDGTKLEALPFAATFCP